MALKRDTTYPGRFVASSTDHPQGAFKNRTSPTAQDGSYLEAQWANDWDGFFARVLNVAGVTPNGTADTGSASQLYDALIKTINGRMITSTRYTTSGTYTKSNPNVKFVKVRVQAGGGGGGGCAGTVAAQSAAAGGGCGGQYGESTFIDVSAVSSVSYTVGAAGTGGAAGANTGVTGGNTSFGSYISVGGGVGGVGGPALGATRFIADNAGLVNNTGTNILLTVAGGMGRGGIVITSTSEGVLGGKGGDSFFGRGGQSSTGGSSPGGTLNHGGGGSGSALGPSVAAGIAGGTGGQGCIIIEEYL